MAAIALSLAAAAPDSGAETEVLSAPVGVGGGSVSATAGTIQAQISTGDSIAGAVATGGLTNDVVDRGGYTGQLFDPVSLQLGATPATLDEGGVRQLSAMPLLDDGTTVSLAAPEVTWDVVSGPVAGIDSDGLASGGAVYQDTAAEVGGDWRGVGGLLALTVLDVDPDNFGSYAGDHIDDDWQVGFFGLDNPEAAPELDPDGDEQDNLFEFLALVDPTDPLSFFNVEIEPVQGQPLARQIVFFPTALAERDYFVLASPDLEPGNFALLEGATVSDDGGTRTVTDNLPNPEVRRFYRVDISND